MKIFVSGITLIFARMVNPSRSFMLLPTAYPICESRSYRRWSRLWAITEWRKQDGDQLREVLMLPFRADKALVPGQSLSCTLNDGRFFDLFQDCVDEHCSVLGMALMGDDGILKTVVLCEINEYSVDAGFRGRITVRVTLKAVGRATLVEFVQTKPIMTAVCRELVDHDDDAATFIDPTSTAELLIDIQSVVHTLGKEKQFNEAYNLALGPKFVTSELCDWTAASWAAFAVVADKSSVPKALSVTNLVDRLQLGLKVLLEQFVRQSSSTVSYQQYDSEGFQ